MANSHNQKIELQKALYQLLKTIATSDDNIKRQNTVEAIVLTLDQLNLKNKLAAYHQKDYDSAIEFTQRDVRRNIGKFLSKYNILEINERDLKQLAKLEKCFINWVLVILKADCRDEYYKTEEGKEKKRKKREQKLGRKMKRRPSRNSKYQVMPLDGYIRNNKGEIIGTPEQNSGFDIEGKLIGEIGKGTHSLSAIDSLIAKEQAKQKPLPQWIKEYIKQDAGDKLKNHYPRGKKECNCQILLKLFENLTIDEVYEEIKSKGSSKGTIRNWLTKHKSEKSQNRPSCMNLMLQIIQEEYYR